MPLVVAHRGYHGAGGPHENSMAAFQTAVRLGVDTLETDIRRTSDGVLVLHHDPKLADGRRIKDLAFAELPPLPDGQPIAQLEDVADLARRTGVKLAAEIKEGGYEHQVVTELAARMPMPQAELISFDRKAIAAVEAIDSSITTGVLAPRIPEWLRLSPLYPAGLWLMDKLDWHPSLTAAAKAGADYVTVEHRMVTDNYMCAAREHGFGVHAWTVDDPVRMRELTAAGVEALVTDRPDLALRLRAPLPAAPPLPMAS